MARAIQRTLLTFNHCVYFSEINKCELCQSSLYSNQLGLYNQVLIGILSNYLAMLEDEKPMTVGELRLCDLPPVEKLHISMPKEDLVELGKIVSIVDVLVVVEANKVMPPLDIDSILFKSDGEPIGEVFDVFGPIKEPHYSIRFNREAEIKEQNIEKGMIVYFAPKNDRNLTKFAFVTELQKQPGTDASWENDNEIPDYMSERSDDD